MEDVIFIFKEERFWLILILSKRQGKLLKNLKRNPNTGVRWDYKKIPTSTTENWKVDTDLGNTGIDFSNFCLDYNVDYKCSKCSSKEKKDNYLKKLKQDIISCKYIREKNIKYLT